MSSMFGSRAIAECNFRRRYGCVTWKWKLSDTARLPVVLHAFVAMATAERNDSVCAVDSPEHAGLFEA